MLPDLVMLQAQLPSLSGVSKKACLVQIVLGQGCVRSCTITAAAGTILRDPEAYRALEQCGELHWNVLPVPSSYVEGTQLATPPYMGTSGQYTPRIPSLCVKALTPEVLAPLSHPYRVLMMLVNGKRPIEEIAWLLNREPQEIVQMVAALPHLIQF